jgi:hypothetical protein
MPPKFYGTTIGNHDLKIVDDTYTTIGFLRNVTMNKIMGDFTINWDNELSIFNVAN